MPYLRYMAQTGKRVAEMHLALASSEEIADFAPEATRPEDVERWIDETLTRAERVFDALQQRRDAFKEVDRQLATLYHEMEGYRADFEALEEIDMCRQLFSVAEIEELCCLLGRYGVDLEKRIPAGRATVAHASERQQAWREASLRARDPVRCRVAERAQARYGLILYDMTKSADRM